MTTITATFTGDREFLKDFAACGIRYASSKDVTRNRLTVEWHHESDYATALTDTYDLVSIEEMELLNCQLESIG